MSSSSTLLLPATDEKWEVWSCRGSGKCELKETVRDPKEARASSSSTIFGLPSKSCRTLALRVPSSDPDTVRKIVFSQLEKRGLATQGSATRYDCHIIGSDGAGDSLVSVDVLTGDLPENFQLENARTYTPQTRLFGIPSGKLTLVREHGDLVLCAGKGGTLTHSHVLGGADTITPGLAQEVKLTYLALMGEGALDDVNGIALWGDFEEEEVALLGKVLGLTVEKSPRPSPNGSASRVGDHLLPPTVKATRAAKRRTIAWIFVALAGVFAYIVLLKSLQQKADRLDAKAVELEEEVAETSAVAEKVKSQRDRWGALRFVLEEKRYPILQLEHVSRIMPEGVRVTGYTNKLPDVVMRGRARDAATAYKFLKALQEDEALKVIGWGMNQPSLSADGVATFEIKGKMR